MNCLEPVITDTSEAPIDQMSSLIDLPDEVLQIIAAFLDTTSLCNYAASHLRLLASTSRIRHLRVPSVTPRLSQFVEYDVTNLQSLDFSNCNSPSGSIAALIQKCRSIRDLNVVNCNLSFTHLMEAISPPMQLETLSFGHLDKEQLSDRGFCRQKYLALKGSKSIRNIYVELAPSLLCLEALALFLSKCKTLERLHLSIIGGGKLSARDASLLTERIGMPRRKHLKTVTYSDRAHSNMDFTDRLKSYLSGTSPLDERDLTDPICQEIDSLINTKHSFVVMNPRFGTSEETDFLRDGYRFDFDSPDAERMKFPWGTPRGLMMKCGSPDGAERVATFLMEPSSWCKDLVELDLTKCSAVLPGGAHWSDLIESASALRAIAITSCFLPQQGMAYAPGRSSECERQELEHSFLDHLTSTKLKRLCIWGRCGCASWLGSHNPNCRRPDFTGIDRLAHLEELSVTGVSASDAVFTSLANKNVRSVQLSLRGVTRVSELKKFIQESVKLRNFKVKMPALSLGSILLWDSLMEGRSLEQLCIETDDQSPVDLSVINSCVPRLFERLRILHVHANLASNKIELDSAIRFLVKKYKTGKPDSDLQFETDSADADFALPPRFPGRALCYADVENDIARIKSVGWDLK